jgi:hypothetical protein
MREVSKLQVFLLASVMGISPSGDHGEIALAIYSSTEWHSR